MRRRSHLDCRTSRDDGVCWRWGDSTGRPTNSLPAGVMAPAVVGKVSGGGGWWRRPAAKSLAADDGSAGRRQCLRWRRSRRPRRCDGRWSLWDVHAESLGRLNARLGRYGGINEDFVLVDGRRKGKAESV